MVRRLVICALTAGAAVLVATSALAHPGDEAGSSKTTFTRKTEPVTWTMKAGQCSQLPADLSVDGTGSKTTTIAGSVDSRGKHLDVYTETASGTAKDSAGATYTWDYQFSQVGVYKRFPYVAWASDSFDLVAADGTVKVHAFFLAKARFKNASDEGTYTTTFTVGDPVAFNPFVPHCDAL
jgi:hypothetical protein